jgi:hypothetical protein
MLFTTVPQTCRTVCYHMRQNASFQYLSLVLPCGLDSGQVIEKDGERGRNRTFNLLIKSRSNSERCFPAFACINQ